MIFCGDHLQYELDNANTPKEERSDWPLPSFDARDWAKVFCKQHPEIDEDEMVGWFANSLMRGYDERRDQKMPDFENDRDSINDLRDWEPCLGFHDWLEIEAEV